MSRCMKYVRSRSGDGFTCRLTGKSERVWSVAPSLNASVPPKL